MWSLYSRPADYVYNADSVLSVFYETFLIVILLIWLMLILDEGRQLLTWWVVLVSFPVTKSGASGVEFGDDEIAVVSMSGFQKAVSIFFILLPRTIICVWLSWVGTWFLIYADDYEDLILNSVALGFLIEIDNMLYTAVIGDENKKSLGKVSSLSVPGAACLPGSGCLKSVPPAIFYTCSLCTAACVFVSTSYLRGHGKQQVGDALMCLCHGESKECIGAQLLGGLASTGGQ